MRLVRGASIRRAVSFVIAAGLVASCSVEVVRGEFGRTPAAWPTLRQWGPQPSSRLQQILDAAVRATHDRFSTAGLRDYELAATLLDLRDPARPEHASVRGNTRFYPASIVKLFYLAAAEQWLEDRRLAPDPELMRALRDMIVDSSNDATAYVLDALTSTTSGPPLSRAGMEAWGAKRNAVNRYFSRLGYRDINVNQKRGVKDPTGATSCSSARTAKTATR